MGFAALSGGHLSALSDAPAPQGLLVTSSPWGHIGSMPGGADLRGRLNSTLGIPALADLTGVPDP